MKSIHLRAATMLMGGIAVICAARTAGAAVIKVQPGESIQEAVRGTDVAELSVGTVPTSAPFDLRLAAKSTADEMLGLGFVRDVTAAETGESSVKVYFRKPIAYVGGQDRVIPLNTAAGASEAPELDTLSLPGSGRVPGVAATPNGAWVLIAADSFLVPVLTSNHTVLEKVVLKAGLGQQDGILVEPEAPATVVDGFRIKGLL